MDAALLSQNISATGDVTSSQIGFKQGDAANAASQSASSESMAKSVVTDEKKDDDDKIKGKTIALAQRVGRVTVLLPKKD